MRNITQKELKNYNGAVLINLHPNYRLKIKADLKNKCLIFLNKIELKDINSFTFSWSEFKDGWFNRCRVNKLAFYYSKKIAKEIIKKNNFFFILLKFKFPSKILQITLIKYLLPKLYEYFSFFYAAKEIKENNKNLKIINFSKNICYFEKKIGFFQKARVNILTKKNFWNELIFYSKKFLLISCYQLFILLKVRKITFSKITSKFGLRFYNSGYNLKSRPKITWPILNKNKKDYYIIYEDKQIKKFIDDFRIKKINYITNSNSNPINILNIKFLLFYLFNFIFNFFLSIILFKKDYIILDYIERFVISSIKWQHFVHIFSLKRYISYHDYGLEHIIRNYFLKKSGCRTFHYKHTFAENIYEKEKNYNHYLYGYLNYDLEFHWGEKSILMSKQDKSLSREFVSVGPLINQYLKKKKIKKNIFTVTFFTSQLGTSNSVSNERNHELFLDYILKIQNINKIKINLKTKYKIKQIKKNYNNIYRKISSLNKFRNINITDSLSAEKLVLNSDIVFSMPFSSTTIEGIFNDIPSFYVDANNQFNNVFYKKNKIYLTKYHQVKNKILLLKNKKKLVINNFKKIKKNIFNPKSISQFRINDYF